MPPLFDAHLHVFSRMYFESLAQKSPLPGSVEDRLRHLTATSSVEIPAGDLPAHAARWISELDKHGVARSVAFASSPEEVDAVEKAAGFSGRRLVPIAFLDPLAPGAADRAKAWLGPRGFRGLLLFPALHRYSTAGPEMAAVAAVADQARAVVYVQCGLLKVPVRDILGLPRTIDLAYANPLDLVPVASAHRNVTFVIPHFGAGLFREALLLGLQCPNVMLDTSSSNAWRAADPAGISIEGVFRAALRALGPERILFGTDSCTFPRGWRRDLLDAQVEALTAAGATSAERALILGGNAEKLFPAP